MREDRPLTKYFSMMITHRHSLSHDVSFMIVRINYEYLSHVGSDGFEYLCRLVPRLKIVFHILHLPNVVHKLIMKRLNEMNSFFL